MKVQLIIGAVVLVVGASPSLGAQQADAAKVATQVCASCHGPEGRSVSPAFPRLAAQQKDYVDAQLKAFRSHTRADPMAQAYMWGMASQLSDDMITKLATYFAEQTPARDKATDPKLVQEGENLFKNGVPGKVVACITCHGPNAAGNGMFPRLAGQHAEYLVKQMAMFKSQLRSGANAPLMHAETTNMDFSEMQAVAAYLASR